MTGLLGAPASRRRCGILYPTKNLAGETPALPGEVRTGWRTKGALT